jgi:hypothetical protein
MKKLRYDYLVIEGNIGTGKTSLASGFPMISERVSYLKGSQITLFCQDFMRTLPGLHSRWSCHSWQTVTNS